MLKRPVPRGVVDDGVSSCMVGGDGSRQHNSVSTLQVAEETQEHEGGIDALLGAFLAQWLLPPCLRLLVMRMRRLHEVGKHVLPGIDFSNHQQKTKKNQFHDGMGNTIGPCNNQSD